MPSRKIDAVTGCIRQPRVEGNTLQSHSIELSVAAGEPSHRNADKAALGHGLGASAGTREVRHLRSKHELPDVAADGNQLWGVHAADDVTDDGPHDLLRGCQAEVRRLLENEASLSEF
jgi:hypothetical protein